MTSLIGQRPEIVYKFPSKEGIEEHLKNDKSTEKLNILIIEVVAQTFHELEITHEHLNQSNLTDIIKNKLAVLRFGGFDKVLKTKVKARIVKINHRNLYIYWDSLTPVLRNCATRSSYNQATESENISEYKDTLESKRQIFNEDSYSRKYFDNSPPPSFNVEVVETEEGVFNTRGLIMALEESESTAQQELQAQLDRRILDLLD